MSRRMLLPLAAAALLLGGVPAMADGNGSTEVRTVERSCADGGNNQYSAPSGTDCKDANGNFDGSKKYQAQYYSNDVQCGSKNRLVSQQGINLYASGDQGAMTGQAGMCSDGQGAAAPLVQGRAGLGAGAASGVTATVDGDKDNAAPNNNETARGWIQVQGKPAAAPTYRCGDEHAQGGRADSDAPQDRDTAAECQPGT
jgi:hypothetical protein